MATDADPPDSVCAVCGQALDPAMSAECNWCTARFHLNQRNDVEAKDCGKVWIDEQYLALQFACDTCLAGAGDSPERAPGGEPEARRVDARSSDRAPRARRYKRRA